MAKSLTHLFILAAIPVPYLDSEEAPFNYSIMHLFVRDLSGHSLSFGESLHIDSIIGKP